MVNKRERLEELEGKIKNCQKCSLYKTATNAVPGEGDENAKVMFIGEGPGFNEDREGRPFVGAAGKLLDSLIALIGLKREEVFIANVVKHRPPGNRDPLPGEIEACIYWLDSQIEIIDPQIIVTLGRFSMAKFIPGVTISRIHGQARKINDRIIIPMFHPAAALRDGRILEAIKDDFQKIRPFLAGKNISPDEDINSKKTQNNQAQLSLDLGNG